MDGKNFQQKLKILGITQIQVAKILGVTQQTVSAMMRNASIKTSTLEKIAKALGRDISMFLDDSQMTTEEYESALKAKDAEIARLNKLVEKLIGMLEKAQ
jgi:transcriptional regulator with XRE-family HTH domain